MSSEGGASSRRAELLALRWVAHLIALVGCGDAAPSESSGERGQDGGTVAVAGTSAGAGGRSGDAPQTAAGHGGGGAAPTHAPGGAGRAAAGGSAPVQPGGDAGTLPVTDDGGAAAGTYPMLQADQIGMPVSVATGFDLAESPLWDPCGQRLLFTDVTASVIHALDANDEVTVLASDTTNANGIAFDVDGSLILAQMGGTGHVARRARDGTITTLEPAGGPSLHTPDDVIVRSDGTIYFSDGDFYPIGSLLGAFADLPVYALKPGATALENGGSVGGPNGIELSADEKTLYVSAYGDGSIVKFDVAADGTLTKGDALISGLSSPDSLCLDAAGNLYVGTRTGLQVLRPDGTEVALIPIPSSTTSCGFGGADGTTLYITSWTTLFRVDAMPIPGLDYLVNRERIDCDL